MGVKKTQKTSDIIYVRSLRGMHTLQAFQYGTVKKDFFFLFFYLDFSHADLGHADFSQSKKTHMPRTCCINNFCFTFFTATTYRLGLIDS